MSELHLLLPAQCRGGSRSWDAFAALPLALGEAKRLLGYVHSVAGLHARLPEVRSVQLAYEGARYYPLPSFAELEGRGVLREALEEMERADVAVFFGSLAGLRRYQDVALTYVTAGLTDLRFQGYLDMGTGEVETRTLPCGWLAKHYSASFARVPAGERGEGLAWLLAEGADLAARALVQLEEEAEPFLEQAQIQEMLESPYPVVRDVAMRSLRLLVPAEAG